MTVPVFRQRVKHTKTRTGCRTCRIRRIKCDEARPHCLKCIKSKRECFGYEVPSADGALEPAPLRPKDGSDSSLVATIPRKLSTMFMVMDMKESMAFDFFRMCTVHELLGSSQALSWERLTLQISHHEPAVTHAVIALAAIHRSQALQGSTPDSPEPSHAELVSEQTDFALDQYNKAVSRLSSYIAGLCDPSDSEVEVVLLLTLLFFCFDVLRVEDESAGAHLYTGLKILYERLECKTIREDGDSQRYVLNLRTIPRTNLGLLAQTFVRLDADMTLYTGQDHALLLPRCDVPIPKSFSSIDEAMVHLDALGGELAEILFAITNVARPQLAAEYDIFTMNEDTMDCHLNAMIRRLPLPDDLLSRVNLFRSEVQNWMSAHAQVRQKKEDEPAHMLASINFFLIWFTITNLHTASETHYDSYHTQFIHMADLCERYLNLGKPRGSRLDTTRPAFTTGTNIPAALFEIASKCRDSKIRRRCVQLFRTNNMAGVFDGNYIASLLDHEIFIEETRARHTTGDWTTIDLSYADIPEQARILDSDLQLDLGNGINMNNIYKRDYGRIVYATYEAGSAHRIRCDVSEFTVQRQNSPTTTGSPSSWVSTIGPPSSQPSSAMLTPSESSMEAMDIDEHAWLNFGLELWPGPESDPALFEPVC